MSHSSLSFSFAIALAAGVLAQLLARPLRLPSIVLLLAFGVVLGPDLLGWVDPGSLGTGLFPLVTLAVAVILFEGGLNLDLRRLRRSASPIRLLVTAGALVTALGGGLAAHLFMGWPWELSFLFGTLVIVTGPTVIRPLLRNVPLRPRLATVLEAEGLLIDPVGAIVAAVTLQLVVAPSLDSAAASALGLLTRIGFGAGAGLFSGLCLVAVLRWRRAVPEGLLDLVALGGALLTFALCEAVLTESGILAVTVAGVVVGNLEPRLAEDLGEFQENLTVGLIGLLFVLLAADVRVADVMGLGSAGLLTVGALALVVRPLGVWLCTLGSDFGWREKAFLSWVAPRGVVAAAIASLAAAFLDETGASSGHEIRALVFLTIGVTVVVQGGSAPLVARLLRVRAPGRDGVVILGAEELGFALGEVLRETSPRVVFADANPSHCRAAEERGFSVVYGDAFDPPTLARMRLERAFAAVGLTPNNEVNHHFAGLARDSYGVRHTYVALSRSGSEVSTRIVQKQESFVLFDRPKDLARWNVRFRHGDARVVRLRFEGGRQGSASEAADERDMEATVDPYILLAFRAGRVARAVRRSAGWRPLHEGYQPDPGDEVAVALHVCEEAAALATLRAAGWVEAPDTAAQEAAPEGTKSA